VGDEALAPAEPSRVFQARQVSQFCDFTPVLLARVVLWVETARSRSDRILRLSGEVTSDVTSKETES